MNCTRCPHCGCRKESNEIVRSSAGPGTGETSFQTSDGRWWVRDVYGKHEWTRGTGDKFGVRVGNKIVTI